MTQPDKFTITLSREQLKLIAECLGIASDTFVEEAQNEVDDMAQMAQDMLNDSLGFGHAVADVEIHDWTA